MRKKSKLPDNLYHFTSLVKYRIILESGKLALTPSNLKFDPDPSLRAHLLPGAGNRDAGGGQVQRPPSGCMAHRQRPGDSSKYWPVR